MTIYYTLHWCVVTNRLGEINYTRYNVIGCKAGNNTLTVYRIEDYTNITEEIPIIGTLKYASLVLEK